MRKLSKVLLLVVLICFVNRSFGQLSSGMAMPDVLIYKTKGDYRKLVPVKLSADRKTVESYPDPGDLAGVDRFLPVELHKGYLLDKTGVGLYTAFIKLTYEEYSKLPVAPSPDELYKMIVDKNPLTELYDCGPREPRKNQAHKLNDVIDEGKVKKRCTNLKSSKYKL